MRALWRYRYVVVGVALVSAVGAYLYTSSKPPVYEAVSRIELRNPYDMTLFRQERGTAFTEIARYLSSQADEVTSPQVMAKASALMQNRLHPAQIRQSISAESSTKIFEVTVRARMSDPALAASTLNAVTKAYRDVSEQQLKRTVADSVAALDKLEAEFRDRLDKLPPGPSAEGERTSLSTKVAEIEAKAGQIKADAAVFGAGIERIDQARPPETPVSDSPRRAAVIFGLLGFIAALVFALWRGERIRVVDSSDDAAGAVDAPLLGVLPRHPTGTVAEAAPVLTAPRSAEARDYEFIASTLTLAAGESETRLILIASAEASSAKTAVALNLALSTAQDQRPVVLLDADPAGQLTRVLGAQGRPGASDLVELGNAGFGFAFSDGATSPVDGLPSFHFVPTGTRETNGRSTAESPQMAKILAHLRQEADLVYVDGPPLEESPGGMKLAAAVDGVVLVVRRGQTLNQLRRTQTMLATAKAPILGIVFDRSRSARRWRPSSRRRSRSRPPSQAS